MYDMYNMMMYKWMACEKFIKNLNRGVESTSHAFTLNHLITKFILMQREQGKTLV